MVGLVIVQYSYHYSALACKMLKLLGVIVVNMVMELRIFESISCNPQLTIQITEET